MPPRTDTNWDDSHRVGIDMTDEEWADLGVLIAARTTPGIRPSYGRFIAETLRSTFREELSLIAKQRKELAARIKGA